MQMLVERLASSIPSGIQQEKEAQGEAALGVHPDLLDTTTDRGAYHAPMAGILRY